MDPKILAAAGIGGIALIVMNRRASAEDTSGDVMLEEDEYLYNGETYQRDPSYENIPGGVTPPPPSGESGGGINSPPSPTPDVGIDATPTDLQNALNGVIARYAGRFESRITGYVADLSLLTVDGIIGPATRNAYIIVSESTIGTDLPAPRNLGFRDANYNGLEFTLDPQKLNIAVYYLTALA